MTIHIFTLLLLFLLKLESHLNFIFQISAKRRMEGVDLTSHKNVQIFSPFTSVIVGDGEDRERRALEKLSQQMEKITKFESTTTKKILSGSDRKHSEISFHPLIINSSKRQAARGQRRREKVPVREPRRVVVVLCARSFLAFIHTWTKN